MKAIVVPDRAAGTAGMTIVAAIATYLEELITKRRE
jgi:hypothetical protein